MFLELQETGRPLGGHSLFGKWCPPLLNLALVGFYRRRWSSGQELNTTDLQDAKPYVGTKDKLAPHQTLEEQRHLGTERREIEKANGTCRGCSYPPPPALVCQGTPFTSS